VAQAAVTSMLLTSPASAGFVNGTFVGLYGLS
jgi:hypothetical protein